MLFYRCISTTEIRQKLSREVRCEFVYKMSDINYV